MNLLLTLKKYWPALVTVLFAASFVRDSPDTQMLVLYLCINSLAALFVIKTMLARDSFEQVSTINLSFETFLPAIASLTLMTLLELPIHIFNHHRFWNGTALMFITICLSFGFRNIWLIATPTPKNPKES